MKVLVTGHNGYLGSAFVSKYSDSFEIVGYDIIDGDNLLDKENLLKKMQNVEMVVHLAAIPKPVEGKSIEDYFQTNVRATLNVLEVAEKRGVKRVIYASSTTVYGIEKGIPFKTPIKEDQLFLSQYMTADRLSCRDVDLSYHVSKVMAEQLVAWYGLNKKSQTVALRFGPIGKVFLGTSVSMNNATQAIYLSLTSTKELWYEAFSIVDEIEHISIEKAKKILGYIPEVPKYSADQIHSTLDARTK